MTKGRRWRDGIARAAVATWGCRVDGDSLERHHLIAADDGELLMLVSSSLNLAYNFTVCDQDREAFVARGGRRIVFAKQYPPDNRGDETRVLGWLPVNAIEWHRLRGVTDYHQPRGSCRLVPLKLVRALAVDVGAPVLNGRAMKLMDMLTEAGVPKPKVAYPSISEGTRPGTSRRAAAIHKDDPPF